MQIPRIFVNLLVIILFLLISSTRIEAQSPPPNFLFLDLVCQNTTTNFTATFQANRDSVLASLASNGTRPNGFYNTTSGRGPDDMVYGLFDCRGNLTPSTCQQCVSNANSLITQRCPQGTNAIVWHLECLVRYSSQNIISRLLQVPSTPLFNGQTETDPARFNRFVTSLLNDSATEAANQPPGVKKFAAREANYSSNRTVYTMVQCTSDLSTADCSTCLRASMRNQSICCSGIGSIGSIVFNPSCTVRYEIFSFLNQTTIAPSPPLSPGGGSNWIVIFAASLSGTLGLALFSVSGFLIWRRWRRKIQERSQEVQLLDLIEGRIPQEQSTENEGRPPEFPSIQLEILLAATNRFSDENKLGEGGFGPVYKGILSDGKEIAVKRLSITSGQGLVEFKNEIMLIAKLQHRNLVRLFGCCIEKNEKLLVYEYMPKRSLDIYLFDQKLAAQLDWETRFSIIKGIARGVMYLHEDSRLRIIHRDLKTSNVLLDQNMNPKISDFGMARIFGEDKNEANTKKVVGTYGYMAPEYAMEGLFSVKSDVFSFGVLLLEIISGKRNNGFYLSESGESLLTFAWKLWSKGEGMELVDRLLVPSCVDSEVLKCIHVGLLCVQEDPADRPTMSSVIFMLASDDTVTLPRPTEPAYSVGRNVGEASESNDGVFSNNEVTITNFEPR